MADDMGRNDHFADGAAGTMNGTSAATAQADPTFHGGSTLMIPNMMRSAVGMSDRQFMANMMPWGQSNSPMMRAQAGEQQAQQELQ